MHRVPLRLRLRDHTPGTATPPDEELQKQRMPNPTAERPEVDGNGEQAGNGTSSSSASNGNQGKQQSSARHWNGRAYVVSVRTSDVDPKLYVRHRKNVGGVDHPVDVVRNGIDMCYIIAESGPQECVFFKYIEMQTGLGPLAFSAFHGLGFFEKC